MSERKGYQQASVRCVLPMDSEGSIAFALDKPNGETERYFITARDAHFLSGELANSLQLGPQPGGFRKEES